MLFTSLIIIQSNYSNIPFSIKVLSTEDINVAYILFHENGSTLTCVAALDPIVLIKGPPI